MKSSRDNILCQVRDHEICSKIILNSERSGQQEHKPNCSIVGQLKNSSVLESQYLDRRKMDQRCPACKPALWSFRCSLGSKSQPWKFRWTVCTGSLSNEARASRTIPIVCRCKLQCQRRDQRQRETIRSSSWQCPHRRSPICDRYH
jgi:hypothetical protein